ncbi:MULTISPECIES: hypothetical protein [Pseudomonas]|uniref:hypothetical protein n=1 Tax=Pseudomonas TaxID=286 RepID=UPI00226D49B3|nr:hypothetical protein [Pseudomonas putida]WAB95953.1 hypothetical protein OSW16_15400 [Pseudomonas putida]
MNKRRIKPEETSYKSLRETEVTNYCRHDIDKNETPRVPGAAPEYQKPGVFFSIARSLRKASLRHYQALLND